MDPGLLSLLNDFASTHGWAGEVARFLAQDAIFILVGALAILALKPGSVLGRRYVFGAALASLLALGIGQVLSQLWDRPRPFVGDPGTVPLIAHSADSSFPSDHAIVVAAVATSLFMWNRRLGLAALCLAALICIARVAAGVHYPADVLAGALLGAACALIMRLPPLSAILDSIADRVGGLYGDLLRRARPPRPAQDRVEG
jgi:membrane-associated phospholipid phosphatase